MSNLSKTEIARRRELVDLLCHGQTEKPKHNPNQPLLFGGVDGDYDLIPDRLEFVQDICYVGYAEPGYDDPEIAIVIGNWNHDEQQIPQTVIDPDGDPEEMLSLGDALEELGCDIQYYDEWTLCDQCTKLVRTQGDSYGWKASYWCDDDCQTFCHECIKKDPKPYIESKVGNDQTSITIDGIDLEKFGFVRLDNKLEHGWYGGQDDNPRAVGKSLREKGIYRYVFVTDSVGQFDLDFSVWADKKQCKRAKIKALDKSETRGKEDPAEVMKRRLKGIQ